MDTLTKDYSQWHKVKTTIEHQRTAPVFRKQGIWWCSLGANVGTEEDGKHALFERPVLIVRKFNKELFWALPITTKKKEGKFYHSFRLHKRNQTVLLTQFKTLSGKRLIRRLGKISDSHAAIIEHSVILLLKETDPFRDPRVPNGSCIYNIPST